MSQFALMRTIRNAGTMRLYLVAATAVVFFLPLLSGCGEDSGILAKVGDREITADYYQDRLVRLTQLDLPMDDHLVTLDTNSLESKLAFLNVIVNKELMVLKAIDLGYEKQEEYINAERILTQMTARDLMHADLIDYPVSDVTDADIEDYYAKRQEKRHFQFIICNFKDDASEARQKILDGELWEDVAQEYNDGSTGARNDYTMDLQYGIADDAFESALFSLEIGQMSEPVDTVYGYWIVRFNRLEEVRERPLDDNYREQIRRVIAQRRSRLQEKSFLATSKEKHEFFMDEGTLWLIFQGLPENEGYLDPATNEPIPKDQLAALDVPAEESDRIFYSVKFDLDEEPDVWTLGRYKAKYAEMSAFQRPKRNKMLGGVRKQIITDMVMKGLLMVESEERGYREDPRVLESIRTKLEELMIDRFHTDVIKFEEYVSSADVAEFWAEHSNEYMTPERREGHVVICADEAAAESAREAIVAGEDWDDIYGRFAAVKDPVSKGALSVAQNEMKPERDAVFAVETIGDVTPPFRTQSGWAVMRLDNIVPPAQREMKGAANEVSKRIKRKRQDQALKTKLAAWSEEFTVIINEDALAAMPSWDDLKSAQ